MFLLLSNSACMSACHSLVCCVYPCSDASKQCVDVVDCHHVWSEFRSRHCVTQSGCHPQSYFSLYVISFGKCHNDPVLSGNGSTMTTGIGKRGNISDILKRSVLNLNGLTSQLGKLSADGRFRCVSGVDNCTDGLISCGQEIGHLPPLTANSDSSPVILVGPYFTWLDMTCPVMSCDVLRQSEARRNVSCLFQAWWTNCSILSSGRRHLESKIAKTHSVGMRLFDEDRLRHDGSC